MQFIKNLVTDSDSVSAQIQSNNYTKAMLQLIETSKSHSSDKSRKTYNTYSNRRSNRAPKEFDVKVGYFLI